MSWFRLLLGCVGLLFMGRQAFGPWHWGSEETVKSRQTNLRNCKVHGLFPDFPPCLPIPLVLWEASGLRWELEAREYPHQVSLSLGGAPRSGRPLQLLGTQAKARPYHFGTLFHRQMLRAGHSFLEITQLRVGVDLSILPGLV